ncbi:MAG: type IV pilus assembly protein PilM [Armatimonadota bacterium]|nr:type IV pilus assembly protein PilM [Armatimonadota bacterium]MDR7404409.1 type IV pilus assembly protein PilM [Armatimonadota bacterium]
MPALADVLQIGAVAAGVDVGRAAIKIAEIRRTARGVELHRAAVAPTPPGAVAGGVILDPAAVGSAVDALRRRTGIRSRRAVVAVTGQNVLARVLRLPPIPEEEVRQAIRWEAERHLPIPVDEAVIDVQAVGEVTEDGQRRLEVLLAAAPESVVLAHVQAVERARMTVEAVEVGALAMVRGLGHTDTRGTRALVNLGASTTDVAVVRDGVPQFTRTIPAGLETVAAAVGRLAGVDAAAAQQVLARYGLGWDESLPELPPGTYATEVTAALEEVVTQLRRTLDFVRAQFAGVTVSEIVLCGGGARLRHMDRHLTAELDLPVTVGVPPVRARAGRRGEQHDAISPQLAVAVGLALRTVG